MADIASLKGENPEVEISLDDIDGDVRKEIEKLRLSCKKRVAVDEAAEGDFILLDVQSESGEPKFNKKGLMLTIGLGLFDKAFETELIGHKVGEAFKAKGADVVIRQCQRTTIPEFTDETVAACPDCKAKTVNEFIDMQRKAYMEMYEDAYLEYIAEDYALQLLEASEFDIDEDELEQWVAGWQRKQEEYCDFHDVEPFEGEEELNREDATVMFNFALASTAINGEDPKKTELSVYDETDLKKRRQTVCRPIMEILKPNFSVKWVRGEAEE